MHITMISRYKVRSDPVPTESDGCICNAVILCAETVMDSVMHVRRKVAGVIHYFLWTELDKTE
jgi:hypothetical protein